MRGERGGAKERSRETTGEDATEKAAGATETGQIRNDV